MDNYVYEKLVNLITANVLRKMDIKVVPKIDSKSCLILLPNICLGMHEYLSYINKEYGGYSIYLGLDNNCTNVNYLEENRNINLVKCDLENIEFINLLDQVDIMIVLGLKINQMKAIIQTDDTETINHIILSRLMANKLVNIMINPNDLILNKIAEIITNIRNLGIQVTNIKQDKNSLDDKVDLITENYVINLKKNGIQTLLLDKNQLITPLAKDKLHEFKIEMKYNEEDKK